MNDTIITWVIVSILLITAINNDTGTGGGGGKGPDPKLINQINVVK